MPTNVGREDLQRLVAEGGVGDKEGFVVLVGGEQQVHSSVTSPSSKPFSPAISPTRT